MKWPVHNFIHDTTTVLLWYVQNVLQFDDQELDNGNMKLPWNPNCDWKIVSEDHFKIWLQCQKLDILA